MTWWSPMEVLGFVRKAGFDRGPARTAVALALTVSGGADHHHWCPDDVPGVDQRGLFALDVSRTDSDDASTLFHPDTNCEWAHALYAHYGRDWHWHPGYATNNGATVRAILLALDTDKGWMNKPAHFLGRTRSIARPFILGSSLKSVSASPGSVLPATQGELWPQTT